MKEYSKTAPIFAKNICISRLFIWWCWWISDVFPLSLSWIFRYCLLHVDVVNLTLWISSVQDIKHFFLSSHQWIISSPTVYALQVFEWISFKNVPLFCVCTQIWSKFCTLLHRSAQIRFFSPAVNLLPVIRLHDLRQRTHQSLYSAKCVNMPCSPNSSLWAFKQSFNIMSIHKEIMWIILFFFYTELTYNFSKSVESNNLSNGQLIKKYGWNLLNWIVLSEQNKNSHFQTEKNKIDTKLMCATESTQN